MVEVHEACDFTLKTGEEQKTLPAMTAVSACHRSCCHMWTFTTPPEYIQNAVERKAQCQYIPEDFSRNDMCETFRAAVIELGQGANLEQLIILKELLVNHWGFQIRVIFRMKTPFANSQITTFLAGKKGCQGYMSCPIRGWENLMKYVLEGKSTQDNIHHSFWRSNLISCEKVAAEVVKSHFTSVFCDCTTYRSKWLPPKFRNRNFTSVFGD
jgi:hypothetical protein